MTGLKLYNTKTRTVSEFVPIKSGKILLYSCGPTVYDYSHIGNFRAFIFTDLLRRYLEFLNYTVVHVTNITDLDDRIIERCNKVKVPLRAFTEKYERAYFEDMELLNILPAHHCPSATEHIKDMIVLIEKLVKKGHAYGTQDGSVFFKIASFPEYGRLSGIDPTQLIRTQRVIRDDYGKEDARDFALWKGWKKEDGDIGWDSPWGKGRPGWHIECSTMSMKYLGEHFDIHCGGVDLIFPHHENEIAQSVCATGKPFVNYWLHCEHLLVNGAKMSKSRENFYILGDLLQKGYSPQAVRFLLLTTHYRQKLNLTVESLNAASASVVRIKDFGDRLEKMRRKSRSNNVGSFQKVEDDFIQAMNDDLNISAAMGVFFNWIKEVNRKIDRGDFSTKEASCAYALFQKFNGILNVVSSGEVSLTQNDKAMIQEREEARKAKNWKKADEIRKYLLKKNIFLEDSPKETIVKKVTKPSIDN